MIQQAAILVGGLGTRLGSLTASTPKPLLPCGDRPFLAWVIQGLAAYGVRHVVLLAGYRAEAISAALPSLRALTGGRVDVEMVREPEPAGTGGALHYARDMLDQTFILCNGDSWFDAKLDQLQRQSLEDGPEVVARMVLRCMADASRYGVAEVEGEVVRGFRERGAAGMSGLISAGIYAVRKTIFDVIVQIPCSLSAPVSLERDVLPRLATAGRLRASIPPQTEDRYFIDIGVPEDFARAQTEVPARF